MKLIFVLAFLFNSSLFADEIKTKDLKNESMNANNSSTPNPTATLSPEQAAELQNQMKTLKENQEKSNKILEELDKEPWK